MPAAFLTPNEAAKAMGDHVSPRAVVRWMKVGLRDGAIKLWGRKDGGRWVTTLAAIQRFQSECLGMETRNEPPGRDVTDDRWIIETLARFGITRIGPAVPDGELRPASPEAGTVQPLRRGASSVSKATSRGHGRPAGVAETAGAEDIAAGTTQGDRRTEAALDPLCRNQARQSKKKPAASGSVKLKLAEATYGQI